MENTYKVEFVPSTDRIEKGMMAGYSRPMEGLDLAVEMEALLIERKNQGYRFVQMMESNRTDPINGKIISGIFVVFQKE